MCDYTLKTYCSMVLVADVNYWLGQLEHLVGKVRCGASWDDENMYLGVVVYTDVG